MPTINISVNNRIASSPEETIVCGNSDYIIRFDFSEEWEAHKIKTARFIWGAGYTDIVFEGDTVKVPVLRDTTLVAIGVFAGELTTTTPALVRCLKSILCEDGPPHEPTPDVYAQIITMIESGALKGEKGDKGDQGEKGDKGDQGEKGDKGDAYTLTDEDKAVIVNEVLSKFTDVSEDWQTVITFSISGVEYTAIKGMTWGEWCEKNPEYGFYVDAGNYVSIGTGGAQEYVFYADVDAEDHAYGDKAILANVAYYVY